VSAAPVSVLLLARDETRDLEELLPTLGFAREVVLVWDPRGDRATRDAAERLGARVFERAFDGFGAQRQFALERCREEWVLWLDPDERLDGPAHAALAAGAWTGATPVAGRAQPLWGVSLRRTSTFLGRRIRFCGWQRERVLRLVRRRCTRFDGALVHEQFAFVPPPARAGEAPGPEPDRAEVAAADAGLLHHSYRTREDCEAKLVRYGEANALKAFRAGRRATALDVALRPALRFLRQYVLQLGVLDGGAGFLLCLYAARQVRHKYARLRELAREGSGS